MHIYSLIMPYVALKIVRKSLGARSGDLNRIEFDEHAYEEELRRAATRITSTDPVRSTTWVCCQLLGLRTMYTTNAQAASTI